MAISGLVITFLGEIHQSSIEAIASDNRFVLGESNGSRIAATLDTPDVETDREVIDWLEHLPGIIRVDVVYVGFDEEQSEHVGMDANALDGK
jgi:nitrate reductase NapAB chaperone NapD